MATVYSLKFLEQTIPFESKVEIYRSRNNDEIESQYFVFLDGKLYNFKYDSSNNWRITLLLSETFKKQVLCFPKILKSGESIILLKTETGIDFYRYADNKFNFLLQSHDFDENIFHDAYDWHKPGNMIKAGHFYHDKNLIGIISKHQEYGLQFHAVMENQLILGEYPIWLLNGTDVSLLGDISNANFFFADLHNAGQEYIIVRRRSGTDVYQFNQRNELQLLSQVLDSSRSSDIGENLFFPFLTGQVLKDIVLFNASGLFIYQYDLKQKNYNFINYNPLFDKKKGWDKEYIDTVRFKDINFDGREEMFFTGPGGMDILTFDNVTLQWESVFDISNMAIANRHSYVAEVGPINTINTGHSILFAQRENKLQLANIERTEKESYDDFENEVFDDNSTNIATTTLSAIPPLIKLEVTDEEKPHILLRDQLDYSSIFKAVDQDTGKANFKLPLIGLPNFSKGEKINFYYNGNNKASSLMGMGWTFPLGVITMDHQGSIFPEYERYFLLLEDFPQPLLLDSDRSTDEVQIFKLSDQESDTQIVYYKNAERWEIDYKDVKQIYGRRQDSSEDAISFDLTWKNWRGAGSSPSGQLELPTAWFLTEIRSGQKSAIFYTYDVQNILMPSSNKKYTREVYLKTISDNEGNKIVFNYSNKESSEYNLPPLIDDKGHFNTKKVQTRYLAGYSVTTGLYRQDINFIYKVENGKRLLIQIVQERDPTNQPVLQFSYKELLNSPELERVILPAGVSVEFDYYTIGGSSDLSVKISLSCNVLSSYRIDYGQDFVLISYLNKRYHVTLRMFNRALTNEIYSSLSSMETTRFPFLGRSGIRFYEVKIAEDALAFILHYDNNNKDVCLIRKQNNKWSLDPKYFNYDKDAIVQIGHDFIVVLDTNKSLVETIVWNKQSEEWSKQIIENISIKNPNDVLLQVSGKVFFIYNDDVVMVLFKNKNNEWHSKVIIALSGVINSIKRTLNKFDLKSDVYTQLLNYLKNNAFQISNNFILFNRWNTEGTKIYSEIELFSLDRKYEVVRQEHHKIVQDDLTYFSKEFEKEDVKKRKMYVTLAYQKDGDRFKLILKDFRGAIQQDVEEFCKGNGACTSETNENIKQQLIEAHKHDFILNFVKYLANLQSGVALCGNTKFAFNGYSWNVEELKEESKSQWSVSIDDNYVLSKENLQSSIKLYHQGKNVNQKGNLLLDLGVKHNNKILNKYPVYLVFQNENREVNILFYDLLNNFNIKNTFALPRGETLSIMSDHYTLVTHTESTSDTEELILNFRQFFGIRTALANAVIKKLTVNFDSGNKRVTGYFYDPFSVKAVGDILYYEKTYTIPGNEYSSYGMIEELKNLAENVSITHNIYDTKGKIVKTVRSGELDSNKKNIAEKSENLQSILLDMSGNLVVAQFYPYEMKDEEVGYYGFENYEVNKVGAKNNPNYNRWLFNEADVVKKEFSLTGENYLRLSNTRLLGTFQPKNQNQLYVASCWVRSPEKVLEVGTIAPFLKAVIYTANNHELNGYFSEVKFQYDDWYYLEVVIDYFTAQQVLSNMATSINLTSELKHFKTVVSVSPAFNTTLHVDHIRFSPLNSNFQAVTFNFKTKEIKEIINANGLIKRYIYNDYQDKIVSINENGEIEKFSTSTKSSSIERIVNLRSEIQIRPDRGFYEDFNPYSFIIRWKVDNDANWKIAPNELHHTSNNYDKLKLRNMRTTFDSFGLRLYYSLQSDTSVININNVIRLLRIGNNAVITSSKNKKLAPSSGEILLIADNNRLMVWIDGGLYFDEGGPNQSAPELAIYGQVKVSDVMIFIDPEIQVSYFNALNEKVQTINLESANSVILTELLYDELGRQCITTKPTRLQRSLDQSVVAYYSNFVLNKNHLSANSIWKIGRIEGELGSHDPYSFYQITYSDNPMNEKSVIGSPGQEFSVSGPFAKRFTSTTNNQFISRHYPVDKNYRYQVEHKLGGIEDIKVFNNKNNTVAWLVNAPGKKDLLATYEYNDDGKLIQILSPLYHEKVGTFRKLDSQIRFFSHINNESDNSLYVEASYDKKGNTIAKTTLDSGKVEYLYGDGDLLRFNIFYSNFNKNTIENVIYYNYDELGRLINTGKLISPPAKENLFNMDLNKSNTEEYQVFYQSDFEREPNLRGRLKRTITYNDGVPFIEESLFNEDKHHLSKRVIVLSDNSPTAEPLIIATNKNYRAGKLREIEYPIKVKGEPFKIIYSYDKLGRIKAIGVPGKSNFFIDYTHNSNGQIESEHHLPDRASFNFIRKFSYNSASYLSQLEDKFLSEKIYYTEGSYGGRGYGDGSVARTEFKASWHQYADRSKIGLNEKSFIREDMTPGDSKLCFDKLKEAGYLNQYNRQTKIYYPSLEVEFPIICSKGITGRHVQNILGKQGFPSKYGHLYDYGHYQELIKAKYFVGEDIPTPLQPDTFAKEIPHINVEASRNIWNILNNNGYIVADKTTNDYTYFKPHGKQGSSFIRSTLYGDLKNVSGKYQHYRLSLEKILSFYFSKKRDLTIFKLNLKSAISKWSLTGNKAQIKDINEAGNLIIEMLEKREYLQNPLDNKFNDLLTRYQSVIPEIVEVLFEHFSKELGESEFDVEAYDIDENGNHKHYYNGFDRYELKYRTNSNQIESIDFKSFASSVLSQNFLMKHDSRGNVLQALHKGIKNITYHSVSNSATNIELVDGKKLIFFYDAQGERVLKRVLEATGEVKREIHYVRDEFGRSLVEREVTWSSSNLPPSVQVTVYIYGPKGLIGFLRRDQYYSVITDHEGSIRLVVKDGEVVAAYDYLPYGNLMRQYGINSEAHISYRYTGQEWDEEIGLYNYHARFYDPSIGRFYQHDPKMQYFSPYKYAGNSPVSMIDPNGEFAFLLIFAAIALGLTGAYFAGSAASGTYNIANWNFKDFRLYIAMLFGFISGALIPVMLPASVAAFSALGLTYTQAIGATGMLGLLGVYAGMARAANEWDPSKWDWSSPEIWNGALVGFSTFAGMPGGIPSAVNFYMGLSSKFARELFIAGGGAVAAGLITLRLAGRKLDWSKPEVYVTVIESLIFAVDIPMAVHGGFRFFRKNGQTIYKGIENKIKFRNGFITIEELEPWNTLMAKSTAKLLGNTAMTGVSGVVIALASSEDGLDFSLASTYEAIITGAMITRGIYSSARRKYFRQKQAIEQRLEPSETSSKIAKNTVDTYKKVIEDPKIREELFKNYPDRLQQKLNEGLIPNSVLAVAITKDNKAFVAFSGDGGPGFLSTYDLETKGQSHQISTDNSYIGFIPAETEVPLADRVPRRVALNDDLEENTRIEAAIEKKISDAKADNKQTYIDEMGDLSSYIRENVVSNLRLDLRQYFNDAEITRIVTDIGANVQQNGYVVNVDIVNKAFTSKMLKTSNQLKKINDYLKKLKKVTPSKPSALYQIENDVNALLKRIDRPEFEINPSHGFDERFTVMNDRMQSLISLQGTLLTDASRVTRILNTTPTAGIGVNGNRNLLDMLWNERLKKYSDALVHWQPTNCAEPHVVSLVSRRTEVFALPKEGVTKYNIKDIEYLSAYKVMHNRGVPEIQPIARCSNCEEITNKIKNILTDPEWQAMLVNERIKLQQIKAKEWHYRRTLNFLAPNNFTYERKEKKHRDRDAGSSRKKRAAVENNSTQDLDIYVTDNNAIKIDDYEENSDYEENKITDEFTNNTNEKSTNFANNMLGWMRNSVNKLFVSKKILPETASNSHVFQGITDSNTNLTAVTATFDVNSTLLLLDTVIRKVTGQKYISTTDHNATLLESRGYSLDIGVAFEKSMKYAAFKSGISMHRLNAHYIEIQEKVIDKIINGKLDEIVEILISHAEKACPHREIGCPGKLSSKKFDKFIDLFSKRIDVELNEIMMKNKKINVM